MTRVYRMALHLLPAELRRRHGAAMETLFAREVEVARARGRLSGLLAGAAGVSDLITRAAYEQVRPAYGANPGGAHMERSHMDGLHRDGSHRDGSPVPLPSTAQLLRRHAVSFALAFVALTGVMLLSYASGQVPALTAQGAGSNTIIEALLLAVPFTAAMTMPMAVFVAVLHEFTRLGANGTLAGARRVRHGMRRLVVPVLAAGAMVGALALAVTTGVLPRANARLTSIQHGEAAVRNDRSMTVGELRDAARNVGPPGDRDALARVAAYEVEVQKKFALPAACMVLALAGMAIAWRFPRGGTWLVIGASLMVFGAYYVMLATGEGLADRLVVSPFVGMWGANGLVLAMALMAVWRRPWAMAHDGRGPVAIRG